ncbi:MAG: glutamine--tRNA ligase/YqeY domain fusion protein [Candidatus Edwardsbacteria bacterium]|nr:glutamine--tRNA ligase/YqeY domain fusion protein [Candidatus Edwardsbacteria bacterium]MBU1576162.1 glutamine--tRNA ligase/YqeY domain fusion protein [Candidatus Edwardsbacteria bacterium]MBU2463594.1 glutamine--tRNA ligase/YqeY domain fusion protein [Candidatus Edwardsbacteria bacterium]MBU2593202.1 glutamine--tRNA ligase/YqeY domain fusion protein [Candidatus Edwardsbacteria bacterium]
MNNTENTKTPIEGAAATNFIREAVAEDLKSGRFKSVHTRFPPEPNAYLHIGHAKAIWIDYGIALEFNGLFNLRFDDTNPAREEQEFVDAIIEDVKWLGADFGDRLLFASDYFEQMYLWAEELIKKGKGYVCDLAAEEVSKTRGTLTEPGKNSPHRDRGVDENLALFRRMRAGEFPDGSRTLRAKIDMTHPNLNLRDPVMYRILHTPHHRQGDKWCLYPMYDWAHGLEDSIEGITHSLCSLEYEDHRPLYDWFLDQLGIYHPRQIEFARLNMTYTVMSKRKFIDMVKTKKVTGYDDPRLSTLAGMRRRGFSSLAIKNFCERIGVAKRDSLVDYALLEHYVREDLNKRAPRYMGILNPVKVVITNYPEGQSEEVDAVNNPEDPSAGKRKVPFSRELYLERDDFMEEPHKKFYRLSPGREVRLRWAYFITCTEAIKDASGNITELRCTYDPATKGGDAPDGRKVKATLHWVSAKHAIEAEARLYDKLFTKENPDDAPEGQDFTANLNPDSLKIIPSCKCEPALAKVKPGEAIQLERLAYFCVDPDSREGKLVLNRTVPLKESWGKAVKE